MSVSFLLEHSSCFLSSVQHHSLGQVREVLTMQTSLQGLTSGTRTFVNIQAYIILYS